MSNIFMACLCLCIPFLSGCMFESLFFKPTAQTKGKIASSLTEAYHLCGSNKSFGGEGIEHSVDRSLYASQALSTPPDLCVVLVDSLRPDHLGCYGYERDTSPAVDAFAAGAVRFDQAIASG